MQFANWQIDRLRRSLNRYRLAKGRNGQALPWKLVLDRILMSPVTLNSYDENHGDSAFKEEALRRFAACQSLLQLDKLEDLFRFLVEEKFLRPGELQTESDDLPELLAVHDLLASDSESGRRALAGLPGTYRVRSRIGDAEASIGLHITLDSSERFVRVEEEVASTAEKERFNRRPDGSYEPTRKTIRKGFGLVSTGLDLLHVFVVGETPENRITYVQAQPFKGLHKVSIGEIELLRCGDTGQVMVRDGENRDAPALAYSVYRFEGHRPLEAKGEKVAPAARRMERLS